MPPCAAWCAAAPAVAWSTRESPSWEFRDRQLLTARLLARDHEVCVFEANDYAGGHTNTVSFEAFGNRYAVDTGFMVYNERTYPNFVRMLRLLGVSGRPSDMSFSVRCSRSGLEYQGSSLNGLFAQRRNLFSRPFYRMLRDILRFNRGARELLQEPEDGTTLGDYLQRRRYGPEFIDHYLVPMGAAIWSARPEGLLQFPARFLITFFDNHGLLQVTEHPRWQTVEGGSVRYVKALTRPFAYRIRFITPVRFRRREDHVLSNPTRGYPAVRPCRAGGARRPVAGPARRRDRGRAGDPVRDPLPAQRCDPASGSGDAAPVAAGLGVLELPRPGGRTARSC